MNIRVRKFHLDKLYKFGQLSDLIFRGIELKVVSQKLRKLSLTGTSMDLGCGDGFLNKTIFKDKFDFGIDNDEAGLVKVAIKKKRYKKILIESATKMSLANNSLDLIFSNSVIEHIPDNKNLLKEVSRVLKPNGYFIFTCPSSYFTTYLTKNFGGPWYSKLRNKQFNHYQLLDHRKWKKRLNKNRIKLINYFYYMSEADLVFWEKILWQQKLHKYLPFIFEDPKIFRSEIISRVEKASPSKKEGSNILIIAQRK